MIIHVAGTRGAGKTYLVGKLRREYEWTAKVSYAPPRWIGFLCGRGERRLFVPGTWEDMDKLHAACMIHHEFGCDVLREGGNVTQMLAAQKSGVETRVVMIDHSAQDCAAIALELGRAVKLATIKHQREQIMQRIKRARSGGVRCEIMSREEAAREIRSWLT